MATEPTKGRRADLSAGMEHMRPYVIVNDQTQQQEDPSVYGVPGSLQPVRRPKSDRPENAEKRTDPFQFGSRFLEEGDNIFDYNAWDHVEVDDEYKKFSEEQYERQRQDPVNEFDKKRFNDHPERFWNKFYSHNTSNFFKDRKWLKQEFPILSEITQPDAPPTYVLENGAGAGNTAYPILALNQNSNLTIHACDFSKKAVEIIRSNPVYSSDENVGRIVASVWDVASPPDAETGRPVLPEGVTPSSVDIVILIFIFSALEPRQWQQALSNIWCLLKPGGTVLFRDYGRGDLAQVRFKKDRYLDENFYVRGDGTRVYFFAEDELQDLFTGRNQTSPQPDRRISTGGPSSSPVQEENGLGDGNSSTSNTDAQSPAFEVVDFGVDRRMLVNRQRKLKMYRCWLQARFRKPGPEIVSTATTLDSSADLPRRASVSAAITETEAEETQISESIAHTSLR